MVLMAMVMDGVVRDVPKEEQLRKRSSSKSTETDKANIVWLREFRFIILD